jgi:integrase
MASISRESNGRRTIQFVGGDGKRRSIRLGKVSQRLAETIQVKVEHLVAAQATGGALDGETARWVATLDDPLADKLAAVGLIAARKSATVGGLLDAFFAANTHAKPATLVVWGQVARCLREHFGENRPLRTIGPADAEGFRQWLSGQQLAATTITKRVQFARQFFAHAVRCEWLDRNPFADVSHKGGDPRARQCYISIEETEKLIGAAPNWVWRTIIALARYGGLRCPSEVLSLRIADLDWERGAMTVTSPKTENHGQGQRTVPMFARLRPFLEEAWDMAQEGQTHVIPETMYLPAARGPRGWNNMNLRTTFAKIIKRAGLEPWPRLFHALRASCESDLAREYPITTVCRWIGNTVAIAARHYVQVTDADFQRACTPFSNPVQNPVQQAQETACKGWKQETRNPGFSGVCEPMPYCTYRQMEAAGIEPASRDVSARASTRVVG